jgi:hypothetical protein
VGLWFLIIAGIGEAMASVFDVRNEIGRGIAGLLGVIGFPIAALLQNVALGRKLLLARDDVQRRARNTCRTQPVSPFDDFERLHHGIADSYV